MATKDFQKIKSIKHFLGIVSLVLVYATTVYAQPAQSTCTIDVKVDKPMATIQPTLWEIFFEDINTNSLAVIRAGVN